MKIALCISGQMRNFRGNFSRFYRTVIEPTDPDIFIDTWSDAGSSTVNRDQDAAEYADCLISKETLEEYYHPVCVRVEDFKDTYLDKLDGVALPSELKQFVPRSKGTLPMYYKMYRCDMLRQEYEQKHGFKYDLVIRARADMFLDEVLDLEKLKKHNAIYRVKPRGYEVYPSFVWDVFFIGNSEVMSNVCGAWGSLESYWREARLIWKARKFEEGGFEYWKVWKGSYLLSNHVNRLGLRVETMNCSYQLEDKYRVESFNNNFIRKVCRRLKKWCLMCR